MWAALVDCFTPLTEVSDISLGLDESKLTLETDEPEGLDEAAPDAEVEVALTDPEVVETGEVAEEVAETESVALELLLVKLCRGKFSNYQLNSHFGRRR